MLNEQPKKTKKSTILRYAYILLTVVVIVLFGVLDQNFSGLVESLASFDLLWLVISICGIFMYWITDGLLLKDITSYLYDGKFSFWTALKVGIIGLYYGALTPSATGGQPMQIVYMRRSGINTGTATGIVAVKLVTYELAICLLYIVFMLCGGAQYFKDSATLWMTIVGFGINFAAVVFVIVIMISRTFIMKVGTKLVNLFAKIRIFKWRPIKDKEKTQAKFENTVNEFTAVIHIIMKHKRRFLGSLCISILNMLFYFGMIYLVYRSMGLTERGIMELLSLNTFMYLAVSLVPTPGSAGASEAAFYLLFAGIFPSDMMFMGMLLWRFYVYYLILFVGSGVVVYDEVRMMRRKKVVTEAE